MLTLYTPVRNSRVPAFRYFAYLLIFKTWVFKLFLTEGQIGFDKRYCGPQGLLINPFKAYIDTPKIPSHKAKIKSLVSGLRARRLRPIAANITGSIGFLPRCVLN